MQAWSPSVAHFKGTCKCNLQFFWLFYHSDSQSPAFLLYISFVQGLQREPYLLWSTLSAVRFPDSHTVQDLCISSMQKSLLPLQLQTVSATTVFPPYPSRRPNTRVRETPQPFPASSFPASVSTQLKPQNKRATNKNRIDRVAESPHPDSMKVWLSFPN